LSWPVPARTSGGKALTGISAYSVYRGELDPSSSEAAAGDLSKAVWKAPFQQIGKSENNAYSDTALDFGRTYLYVVRSVTQAERAQLESADSVPAIVTPRDVFPPAAPQNVVIASLPGAAAGSESVELSWSIGVETDLAGYRIYRSEEEGTRGDLLTPELLLAPAYRDNSVAIGHHYWYTITAVDRFNNESLPSVSSVVAVAPSL
jgi:fibronectin type 3 domain-containing protein